MKIKNIINKNATVEYLLRCIYRVKDKDFRDFVLAIDRDYGIFRFEHNGNANADKNIYVVEFLGSEGYGMFAMLRNTIEKLAYADRFLLTPVVRWGNKTLYSEVCGELSAKDTFEYYFEPITIDDPSSVDYSYMVAHNRKPDRIITKKFTYNIPEEELIEMSNVLKKYIRLNKESQQYIYSNISNLFQKKRILGVHVRGTDYFKAYNGHPIAITAKEYLDAAMQAIEREEFDYIFLATDEFDVVKMFRDEFNEKMLFYQDVYRSKDNSAIHGSNDKRPMHKYMLGMEVLRDMYTLAECDGLIAGLSNVSTFARIVKYSLGKEYLYQRIFDKGTYSNDNKCSTKSVKYKKLNMITR